MNRKRCLSSSHFFLCLLLAGASVFANDELRKSPDGEYNFELQNAHTKSEFLLLNAGQVIWRRPTAELEKLSGSWTTDSRKFLFVSDDRYTLNYLQIKKDAVLLTSIDQKAFDQMGDTLIPYNWSIPNQGSIPHNLIEDLQGLREEGKFSGTFIRAKWPHKYEVKFVMAIPENNGKVITPLVTFSEPRSIPW